MGLHPHKRDKILTSAGCVLAQLEDDLLEWDLEEEESTLDITSQGRVLVSILDELVRMAAFLGVGLDEGDGKSIAPCLKDTFGEDRAFSVDFGLTHRRHG